MNLLVRHKIFVVLSAAASLFLTRSAAVEKTGRMPGAEADLNLIVSNAVARTVERFADTQLREEQIALTLIDLKRPGHPVDFRGQVPIYPASVIKLFYLVAVHQWLEEAKLRDTPELRRAMRDMIVESYNEATGYVVDLLTDTTSGPELPEMEIAEWFRKRNAVNHYFEKLGYERINANKKPWCEGPYGRETQAIQLFEPRRNMLTTSATARLLAEIAEGRAVSPARSREMLGLLERNPFSPRKDPDDQAHGFTGPALPPGAQLWSKAGWTSETRHDAAYLQLPSGSRIVLVIFTTGHSNNREIIPFLARPIVEHFARPN